MKQRRIILGLLAATVVIASWMTWRLWSTPAAPTIDLTGVDQPIADAVRTALQGVRNQPRSGEAWGTLGMVLSVHHYDNHVPQCYREAARFDSGNPAWPYLLGVHYLEFQPQLAKPLLEKALKLTNDPREQAAIQFKLGRVLIEEEQLGPTEERLQALNEIEPNSPRVQYLEATLALAKGDRTQARDILLRLSNSPFYQKWANTMLATLTEGEQSRNFQERAGRLPFDLPTPDPFQQRLQDHYVSRMNRIAPYEILEKQGKHKEAIQFLRNYAAKAPDEEVCFLLGQAYYFRNQWAEAEKMLRAAISFERNNSKTHRLLSSCLLLQGEKAYQEPGGKAAALDFFQQAVQAADDALALKKEYALAYQERGRALKYLRRKDEALRSLKQAALIQPEVSEMHLYLGEMLAEEGHFKEGLEHLQFAVQFATPNDPKPQQTLQKWSAKSKTLPENK